MPSTISAARIEKTIKGKTLRTKLMAYLEGGPVTNSLLEVAASDLQSSFVSWPEVLGPVDERLGFLWAATLNESDALPSPPSAPELGFDRFRALIQMLENAGIAQTAATDFVLIHNASSSRWWPSTGVWVWEQLRAGPKAFVDRVLSSWLGAARLADVLTSVIWLPEALEARSLLREVCADRALVPDKTIEKMKQSDEDVSEFVASVERRGTPGPQNKEPTSKIARRFLPSLTVEEAERALAKLSPIGIAKEAKARSPKESAKSPPSSAKQQADRMSVLLKELGCKSPEGKRPGATSFAMLEKHTPIPEALRALWTWSDGCKRLLSRLDASEVKRDAPVLDNLYSVKTAASELKANRDAGMPDKLIPFGGEDGSADSLVLDCDSGEVLYWDHEEEDTSPIAGSLVELLERSLPYVGKQHRR